VLTTWLPRALKAGAEIRDLAMVGRVEVGSDKRVTGVHYHREGVWRFQKARNVVVAGYAIETPRLLLNSACPQFPDGLANSTGLVGRNLMAHSNQGVYGVMEDEIRWYKGPPSLAITEHWNYTDAGKDFHGGYSYMSTGPLPVEWAGTQTGNHKLWGDALHSDMERYIHYAGLKIVGETQARPENRVRLAEEKDRFGLPIAHVTFSYGDNDHHLIAHAKRFMRQALEAAGGRNIWAEDTETAHLMGTCRMGDDPRTSVVNADGRSWDIPNLWICDGSLFPTSGGVNPSLTIQALACRIGDRIAAMAARGELSAGAKVRQIA
jgi:choline dehydrogenase-like flavoprotein